MSILIVLVATIGVSLGFASPAQAHTVGGCRSGYVKVFGYNLQPCDYSVDRGFNGHINVSWPAGLTDVYVCGEMESTDGYTYGQECTYINNPNGGVATVYFGTYMCMNIGEQFYLKASIKNSGHYYGDVEGPVEACHWD
jgi:hypothetical protein